MKYIIACTAAAAALLILMNPAAVGGAVRAAVNCCLEVMIPSLFAFTVLAVYLQSSGLYRVVLKPFTLLLSKLLRLDEELCAVLVLGNIGGYPVGARLITELVKQGRLSQKDGGRMLCFCYGSGPSFVVSIVGLRVFGSAAAGGVIFAGCFAASLIIAAAVCRSGEPVHLRSAEVEYNLSGSCFVSSVLAAAKVMYTVCAMIVGFSVVTAAADITGLSELAAELFELLGFGGNAQHILPSLLEISRVQLISSGWFSAPFCGGLLAFGGVCVLLQIAAVTEGRVPMKHFVLSRIPAVLLSSAFSCAAVPWCEEQLQEYIPTSGEVVSQFFSVNAGMSVCVLVMCGILLSTCNKSSVTYSKNNKTV